MKDYDHQGTANMYFEVVNAKNKKQPVKITFLKQDIDTVHFLTDTLTNFTETKPIISKTFLDNTVIEQNARFITHGIMLKTVNIKERKQTPTELVIKSHVHRFDLDPNSSTLDLVNITSSLPGVDIINYIQGRFPGLQIYISPDGRDHIFKYRGYDDLHNQTPFFYVDEALVSEDEVLAIPLQDVALIRFAPPPVWFAPLGGGFEGAILVYTKGYGDNNGTSRRKAFDRYTFNGYSVIREFSLPDYSITKQKQAADYRTTLYWNHDLYTDDKGNIKIRFYNSDKAKKYRVVIQGMGADGRVGYLSKEF